MRTGPFLYVNCERCHLELELHLGDIGSNRAADIDMELAFRGWLLNEEGEDICDECRKEQESAISTTTNASETTT